MGARGRPLGFQRNSDPSTTKSKRILLGLNCFNSASERSPATMSARPATPMVAQSPRDPGSQKAASKAPTIEPAVLIPRSQPSTFPDRPLLVAPAISINRGSAIPASGVGNKTAGSASKNKEAA